jgi:hypothetical protein
VTRRNTQGVEVLVADDGAGFDLTDADRMFRPVPPRGGSRRAAVRSRPGVAPEMVTSHAGTITPQGRPGVGAAFIARPPSPRRIRRSGTASVRWSNGLRNYLVMTLSTGGRSEDFRRVQCIL